jgi:hypothetical protein
LRRVGFKSFGLYFRGWLGNPEIIFIINRVAIQSGLCLFSCVITNSIPFCSQRYNCLDSHPQVRRQAGNKAKIHKLEKVNKLSRFLNGIVLCSNKNE